MHAVVRSVSGVISETWAGRVKDLPDGILPDAGACESFVPPGSKVHADALASIFQGTTATNEDNNDDEWHAHSKVDDSSRPAGTTANAGPDEKPEKGVPSNKTSIKAAVWIRDPIARGVTGYGRRDIIQKVVLGSPGPFER